MASRKLTALETMKWMIGGMGLVAISVMVLVAGAIDDERPPITVMSVRSSSMEPTIHCARGPGCRATVPDVLFVAATPVSYPFHYGSIVLIRRPEGGSCTGYGTLLVKRVVGMPGDQLTIGARGQFGPNGNRLASIPAGSYDVRGDNREGSCDSRDFGLVTRDEIVGVVFSIVHP